MPIMIFMTKFYHSSFCLQRLFFNNILKALSLILVAGINFIAGSCEEDPSKIGKRILPPGDFVNILSTDSIKVRSFTMYSDSIESDNPSTSYLGQLTDPYFGTTTAEFVTQIRLGSAWDTTYTIIDSIKLYMELLNVQGAVDKPQYLTLSEISEQIYDTAAYYSSQDVPLTGFTVTDIALPELKADTINDIVIDIPVDFGVHVTRTDSMLFHSSTKPDFRSYFKGLLFQLTSPEDPVFATLSIDPPGATGTYTNFFVFFLRDPDDNKKEFYFIIDAISRNAAFNLYKHDLSTADPDKRITHINDGYADTMSYVQMMNGVFTKIIVPGLENIKNDPLLQNISVNKARLIMPVVYDNDVYKPSTIPAQVYLRYLTNTGERFIVPDYSIGPAFYDGTPDTTKNVYNINIATYVQRYLEDTSGGLTTSFELFLLPGSSNNVILKANDSNTPVRFEFTYTRF